MVAAVSGRALRVVVSVARLGHLLLEHRGVALDVLRHDLDATDLDFLGLVDDLALGHCVDHALLPGLGNFVHIHLKRAEGT